MTLERDLDQEIIRWKQRLEQKRKKIILLDKTKPDFLKNIDSYISDANHFYNKKDLIRAFEAVVWSWAWIEIGERLEILGTS